MVAKRACISHWSSKNERLEANRELETQCSIPGLDCPGNGHCLRVERLAVVRIVRHLRLATSSDSEVMRLNR